MNFMPTRQSSPDLLARYAQLPPGPKLVLRLKTLLIPPVTKSEFVDCMKATGLRTRQDKAWSPQLVNAMLDELRSQGLLSNDHACLPALVHPVAADAGASADAEALATAIRRLFPAQGRNLYAYAYAPTIYRDALHRLIRLAVYTNEATEFIACRDLCDRTFGLHGTIMLLAATFYDVPLAADWIAARHPAIQAPLLEAKLNAFIVTGLGGPEMLATVALSRAQRTQLGFGEMWAQLLRYDLLAGRVDDVRDAAKVIEHSAGEHSASAASTSGISPSGTSPSGTSRGVPNAGELLQALAGAVAFLEGRNEAALQHYRDALKLRRKRLGKRKVFLENEHSTFFLLALLRANDPRLHAEIQAGLDAALSERAAHDAGLPAMQALLWLVQGLEARARELLRGLRQAMPSAPLAAACVALAEHAVDAALSRANRADLAARFEQFRDTLPLIARIYAEILAEVAAQPGPYQAWLAPHGGLAFTRIIQTLQPWERALESLDALLGGREAGGEAAKAPRKAKRLVWFVDPDAEDVAVAEQSAKGRDGWTDGRAVSMKRLHEQDPRLDYLTPQDRAALRTIRKEASGWRGEDSYAFDTPRTIAALVGHPAVFDARRRAQPLELVAYPLELLVTAERDGYRIALSHEAAAATVFLEAETPARYRVIEFPRKMLAVQEILGARGPDRARRRARPGARHGAPGQSGAADPGRNRRGRAARDRGRIRRRSSNWCRTGRG